MHLSIRLLSFITIFGCGVHASVHAKQAQEQTASSTRKAEYPVDKMLINRWSHYAMSGESVSDKELFTLFEAARWAQSSYNNQPWRFIYAKKGTQDWAKLFNLLVPFNQGWCKNAGALVVVVSKKTLDWNAPSVTHSFDAGAACQNLALQGTNMGLVVHGMEGFDYTRARTELGVPEGYAVEAMFAIGRPGDASQLPEEMQKREKPSARKPLKEIVFEGRFSE